MSLQSGDALGPPRHSQMSSWRLCASTTAGCSLIVGVALSILGGVFLSKADETKTQGFVAMVSVGGALSLSSLVSLIALCLLRHEPQPAATFSVNGAQRNEGANYEGAREESIVDLALANPALGYGIVVDGSGHNNSLMRVPLRNHLLNFIQPYEAGLQGICTLPQALAFFETEMERLNTQFKNRSDALNQVKVSPENPSRPDGFPHARTFLDPSYQPAMSVAQVVRLPGKTVLLTAQAGDTQIVVQRADGTLQATQPKTHEGVGQSGLEIDSFDITGAQRIIGLSDGFGEFLTWEELEAVVKSTPSGELFAALQKAVAQAQREGSPLMAANGGNLKVHTPRTHGDDQSLFVLDL